MYPLLLKPLIKDYLWGGNKLKTDFCFETEKEIAAEAWMLSSYKNDINIVLNGKYKGKKINEVLELWGLSALGKEAEKFLDFPLLIKLIDARQKLSIQVHPDDTYALMAEGEHGKTEMWYVLDCEEGAEIVYGFKENISKEEFRNRIINNNLTDVCNFVPVHKGDVFFIEAGTLHSICGGIFIAEVQQNSDITYRVFDYDRLGIDGKPRKLHIDKALDVTKCEISKSPYGNIGKVTINKKNIIRELSVCDKFSVELLELNGMMNVCYKDSFVSLIVLDGNVDIKWIDDEIKAKKGDSIFIPAGLNINLDGNAEILYSYV